MRRPRTHLFLFVGLVLLAAPAMSPRAGEDPSAAAPVGSAADFKPGALRLPLTVHERSGVERKAAVVSSGVPFPPGFLPDVSKLAVVDKDNKLVFSQASLMVKWHKPAYDDSVQWALVSFAADVPAGGTATYYLTDDGGSTSLTAGKTAPASPLKAVKGDKDVAIETGAAKFVVPLEGESLLASAEVGGRNVLGPKGLQCVITTGDWPDRGVKAGDRHTAAHDASGVTIEESGPARVVVAVKGRFKPGDKDGKLYGFTTRLYFEAGSASVRAIHTISNGQLDPKLYDGWRYTYTWPIEDASLLADLALGEKAAVATVCEDKPVSSEGELKIYQDSSGGEKWQKYSGAAFRGYKATEGEKELAAGNAHLGVMSVSGGGAGVSAALRNFRVEFPHALAGSAKELRVGLFPGEFAEVFPINAGQRKSWDLRLTFFSGAAPDPKKEFAVGDALLLFRPDPAWMLRAAAAGCWPYGMGPVARKGGNPALRRDNSRLDVGAAGWDRYGVVGDWNSGGHHWNEESMYIPWVLWGDGNNFDAIEASSLWASDLIAYNWDRPDHGTFYLMLMQWNDKENRVKRLSYPGFKSHDTWGMPDSGHCGMVIAHEYYYLTGDMRAREAVEHIGDIARCMLWKFNHDDRKDGTGPLPGPVGWCKKRDADADPTFKTDTRYVGWPLFNLANAYRLTGDPEMLADCRNVARSFRNTARWSPIGFMTLQVEPKGGTRSLYAFQGPFAKYRDQSASQCYAHFQCALMCHGLWEYYLVSRDIEALDPIVGFADLLTHHCMLKDPEGKQAGWTYAFGDYWGPYTWEDKGTDQRVGWRDWHYNCVQVMGWATVLTGRTDFAEVCKSATAQYGSGFDVAAGVMGAQHKLEPPAAAVTDLKAEALGGGKVKLTWTSPGGPGKAARYQVKSSTSKIVELVSGWPDKTEPLPQDRKEWEARAAAFNARQRAFWAAENLPNAPAPGAAGQAESMEVSGLAAGTTYFALKSWTAGDSMSELSNVVSVEVK